MTMIFFAVVAVHGNSAFGDEDKSFIQKKGQKLKRLIKHGVIPYRHGMGLPKTGQKTSFAAGDDGDLQRGIPWPEPRFIDNGNGTVTDKVSGLMWTKDVQEIPLKMNWYDGIKTCNDLVFAGYDNWRLPNVREMLSLIDFGVYDPALPDGHPFINVKPSDSYWSSTTSLPHTAQAWHMDMTNGSVRRNNKTSNMYHVWPVRRGRQHIW